jgi:hypothetical protein
MVYRALGVLFSRLRLCISFTEFHENGGKWSFELIQSKAYPAQANDTLIRDFIEENNLQYRVALVTVHTETSGTIFNGASIAAATELPVITSLDDLDKELGGNGEFYKSCAEKLGIDEKNIEDINKSVCIAFMGILRWREEYNFLSSVTGASRSSIGGAVWLGQEA